MALNEETEAVFKSSRTDVDPVSGNEVPPGSLPEEVRDDIPAQLSEGEYVVPADVLRFYGMKFFEDLRKQAKIELARMDAEGRIGGEPMGEMEEGDLTPEEMAEIETMMMAVGGYATQQPTQSTQPDPYQQQQMMYRQGAPVAIGNAGYAEGGEVRGYAPGGTAAAAVGASAMQDTAETPVVQPPTTTPMPMGTQANLDFSQFGAGFSFSPQAQQNLQQLGQPTQEQATFTPLTMYAPDGQEVTANTLDEYNDYLSMGYTMAPPAVAISDDDDTPTPTEETEPKDPTSWAEGLDWTNSDEIKAKVDEMLAVSKGQKAAAALGPMGALGIGLNRVTGVARSNAVANIVESWDEGLAEELRTKIQEVEKGTFFSLVPDALHNGTQITEQFTSRFGSGTDFLTNIIQGQQAEPQDSVSPDVDVALGGDEDDPVFAAAVAESRERAETNRAAMERAQEAGASTDDIEGLQEAFEKEGGTWATGGR